MMSLIDFEHALEIALAETAPQLTIGLEKVGNLAVTLAHEYPGHQQPGWAPLAASTLRDKEAKGFAVPSPLLRTGEMAESYEKEVDPATLTLVVGSNDKIALYQEMGTSHIPPRPVLAKALNNALPYAADVFANVMRALLTGRKELSR